MKTIKFGLKKLLDGVAAEDNLDAILAERGAKGVREGEGGKSDENQVEEAEEVEEGDMYVFEGVRYNGNKKEDDTAFSRLQEQAEFDAIDEEESVLGICIIQPLTCYPIFLFGLCLLTIFLPFADSLFLKGGRRARTKTTHFDPKDPLPKKKKPARRRTQAEKDKRKAEKWAKNKYVSFSLESEVPNLEVDRHPGVLRFVSAPSTLRTLSFLSVRCFS